MSDSVDLVLGSIHNLEQDRLSAWTAFHLLDAQLLKVRRELKDAVAENKLLRDRIKKLLQKYKKTRILS